jgi:exosome complex RNA-binding protein Rrp42 (RNase PH superfamily)
MGKDVPISVNERDFVLKALDQGYRLDGRDLLDYRPLHIELSPTTTGAVEVALGQTR